MNISISSGFRRCAAFGVIALALSAGSALAQEDKEGDTANKLRPWTIRVHYHRAGGDYAGWGVYAWKGPQASAPKWPANWKFNGKDRSGVYYDMLLGEGANQVEFLITDGKGNKNCARDQKYTAAAGIEREGQEIWLREGDCTIYATKSGKEAR